MIQELANRIWSHNAFHEDYASLVTNAFGQSFGHSSQETIESARMLKLIRSACHLSGSDEREHREAAYRIVVSASSIPELLSDDQRKVANLVFSRLGNFPAVAYLRSQAEAIGAVSAYDYSLALDIDLEIRRTNNTIQFSVGPDLTLTDFQRRLWSELESEQPIAVTAPTSAGKSFALLNYIVRNHINAKFRWSLFVVPTRALISQITTSIVEMFSVAGPGREPTVSSIPISPEELESERGIYVLTQERAQILIESGKMPHFDVVVIDEAQGIADGQRGITLQTVLESILETRNRDRNQKILFAAPPISNPGLFADLFSFQACEVIRERESPVAQNLVFVKTNPISKNMVTLSVKLEDAILPIGDIALDKELFDDRQKLTIISWEFGKKSQNIVFSSGKAECERIALQLTELASPGQTTDANPRLIELAKFIRTHVHKEYSLAETVLAGIGFHYGNMPAAIRKAIESTFESGELSHLVCTSTLLQGVNMPASNLFMLNPSRGSERRGAPAEPLDGVDFWNLAGRAGRLGKEFEGNVFLIDYDLWKSKPISADREREVVPALERTVKTVDSRLVDFIEDREHPSGTSPAAESAFTKLFNDYRSGKLSKTLDKVFASDDATSADELENTLSRCVKSINVPVEITERNISISPYRQQQMLDYLRKRMNEKPPEEFIPIHPLRSEAYDSLLRILKRVHNHFELKKKSDRSHVFFSRFAINWMRGEPLPRLIDAYHNNRKKKMKKAPRMATSIRETLNLLESDLRFRYVKFLRCYEDLVTHALNEAGRPELAQSIPAIHLFLELGASSGTMVGLISLGFTRTTAGVLQDEATDKNLSRASALEWLRRTKWESRDIPQACLDEVREIIGN
ncbi:DEAD/DEAH box helicase [Roseiconus lacunae]|uniref:DEAD/DEAH box helicase n=1 Tax=Roseiconus lacunae TaxID=2605694 RepID=UPI0011F13FED|nr:DEAD/DEAH box helicase [Roseiconus lacunae]